MPVSSFGIEEHRHRFAVWAAGRAYSRHGPGHGVATAQKLVNASGLDLINTPDDLPVAFRIDDFLDLAFRKMMKACESLTYLDKNHEVHQLLCTYGRAQKLGNMYLKAKLVCAGHESDPRVSALHPPLDSVLLTAIHKSRDECPADLQAEFEPAWEAARRGGTAWTQFDAATYDAYIAAIKLFQGTKPLWAVERLWNPAKSD